MNPDGLRQGQQVDAVNTRKIDVSVVLNLHREGIYIARTLASLDEAVAHARGCGYSVELVVVFDNADEFAREVVTKHDRSRYDSYKVVDVNLGSLGLARNAGIEVASGHFVCTADGDDLISYNYISRSLKTAFADEGNCPALYFPEVMFRFDASYFIYIYRDLSTATPMDFLGKHPYISRAFAKKEVFSATKYVDVRLGGGYAYEDWHFNAQCVAAGVDVRIVPDICLFYRQRAGSLFEQANSSSVRQIPPSKLFEPSSFLKTCAPYFDGICHSSKVSVQRQLPPRSTFESDHWTSIFDRANSIEHKIAQARYRDCPMMSNVDEPPLAGELYFRICKILQGKHFGETFLFPFVARGEADRYMIAMLEAFYTISPGSNVLVILGEAFAGPDWLDLMPPNVTVVNMDLLGPKTSLRDRSFVTLKILQSCCVGGRLHFRPSRFSDYFLDNFALVLAGYELVYYRLAESEGGDEVVSMSNSSFDVVAKNLALLSWIISDNTTIAENDRRRIKLFEDKWKQIYAPAPNVVSHRPKEERQPRDRIVLAIGSDAEGALTLSSIFACELQRLWPEAAIDVYSESSSEELSLCPLGGPNNLVYRGTYDDYDAIDFGAYETLVYASKHEGMPGVLLAAMAAGLGIVAANTGAISELVVGGVSGILVPDLEDSGAKAQLYANAVVQLRRDIELRRRLIQGARYLIAARHSVQAHVAQVASLFRSREGEQD